MSTPLSPFPSKEDFLEATVGSPVVEEVVDSIIVAFYESYKKGHKGVDKQKAYLHGTNRIKILDFRLLDIFNLMTYGERE